MSQPGDVSISPLECIVRNLAAVTPIDQARIVHKLDQDFLAELWLQKRRAELEMKRYEEMAAFAMRAIRSGASIEVGLHTVRVVEVVRKPHYVRGSKFSRLVVA